MNFAQRVGSGGARKIILGFTKLRGKLNKEWVPILIRVKAILNWDINKTSLFHMNGVYLENRYLFRK
jgi:hypothetical protein